MVGRDEPRMEQGVEHAPPAVGIGQRLTHMALIKLRQRGRFRHHTFRVVTDKPAVTVVEQMLRADADRLIVPAVQHQPVVLPRLVEGPVRV